MPTRDRSLILFRAALAITLGASFSGCAQRSVHAVSEHGDSDVAGSHLQPGARPRSEAIEPSYASIATS